MFDEFLANELASTLAWLVPWLFFNTSLKVALTYLMSCQESGLRERTEVVIKVWRGGVEVASGRCYDSPYKYKYNR